MGGEVGRGKLGLRWRIAPIALGGSERGGSEWALFFGVRHIVCTSIDHILPIKRQKLRMELGLEGARFEFFLSFKNSN
jgi:hypothetical protein